METIALIFSVRTVTSEQARYKLGLLFSESQQRRQELSGVLLSLLCAVAQVHKLIDLWQTTAK